MFKSDGTRLDVPVSQPRMVIGRTSTCDIVIPINRVSREHCEITLDGGEIAYKDLNSSNGVLHNGVKSTRGVLKAGDELIIGPVIFTVVVDGHPASVTPVRTILDNGVELPGPAAGASHVATLAGPSPVAPPVATPVPVKKADELASNGGSSVHEAMEVPDDDFDAIDEDHHGGEEEEPVFTFE